MKFHIYPLLSVILITACSKEEPAAYVVPKQTVPAAPQPRVMGSDADNQAVLAAHAAMSAQMPEAAGFTAALPAGWTEVPGSGMRKASYAIPGTAIDFYLISLSMGDVPSNVNRWRGQVELAPASADEIEKQVQTLAIEGHPSSYIEIYNEQGGKGIIAAIVPVGPQYWYFTAKGSVAELKAHAGDIRAFLESLKIN